MLDGLENWTISLSFPISINFQKSRTIQTFLASSHGTWTGSMCSDVNYARTLTFCSAAYLRQTVLLSSYETPEIRSLFNQSLKNLEGRVHTIRRWAPVQVPEGLDQVCRSPPVWAINNLMSMYRTSLSSTVRAPRTSRINGFRTSRASFFHLC